MYPVAIIHSKTLIRQLRTSGTSSWLRPLCLPSIHWIWRSSRVDGIRQLWRRLQAQRHWRLNTRNKFHWGCTGKEQLTGSKVTSERSCFCVSSRNGCICERNASNHDEWRWFSASSSCGRHRLRYGHGWSTYQWKGISCRCSGQQLPERGRLCIR